MKIKSIVAILFILINLFFQMGLSRDEIRNLLTSATVKVLLFNENGENIAHGSGFCVDEEGWFASNFHVIKLAVEEGMMVKIEQPGNTNQLEAKVVNWNQKRDVAVLKVDTNESRKLGMNFDALEFGDSTELKVLEDIYVSGFPITGKFKIQEGMLNARQTLDNINYLDISVLIDQGHSGGPVIDTNGNVVGINVAYITVARSVNLVIPINEAKEFIKDSIKGETDNIVLPSNDWINPDFKTYQSHGGLQGWVKADLKEAGIGGKLFWLEDKKPRINHVGYALSGTALGTIIPLTVQYILLTPEYGFSPYNIPVYAIGIITGAMWGGSIGNETDDDNLLLGMEFATGVGGFMGTVMGGSSILGPAWSSWGSLSHFLMSGWHYGNSWEVGFYSDMNFMQDSHQWNYTSHHRIEYHNRYVGFDYFNPLAFHFAFLSRSRNNLYVDGIEYEINNDALEKPTQYFPAAGLMIHSVGWLSYDGLFGGFDRNYYPRSLWINQTLRIGKNPFYLYFIYEYESQQRQEDDPALFYYTGTYVSSGELYADTVQFGYQNQSIEPKIYLTILDGFLRTFVSFKKEWNQISLYPVTDEQKLGPLNETLTEEPWSVNVGFQIALGIQDDPDFRRSKEEDEDEGEEQLAGFLKE